MHQLSISTVRSAALFVSSVQRSDGPDTTRVRAAVTAAVRAYGSRGGAARVAQEFGAHPETAVAGMRWARQVVDDVFGARGSAAARRHPVAPAAVAHSAHAA